jgi:hypothetical protein
MPRPVFYSFHYDADNARASQVRNMGLVDGNRPATDNEWEQVKRGGDAAIERWIKSELSGGLAASCSLEAQQPAGNGLVMRFQRHGI